MNITTIQNYDVLDNLHLVDTYIQENLSNQKYFKIFDLRKTLSLGIQSFKLDIQKNCFQPGSEILIQIIDSNGKTIFVKYYPVVIDTSRLVTIVISKQVSPGSAVLTILGKLKQQLVTRQ